MTVPVLSVRNLQVQFVTRRGTLRAIDGVSFDIAKGEVLGVVGESGAGKSVTGLAAIGLIDPPGRIAGGEILLSGSRIDNLPTEEMRRIRGRRIGMIFQDPLTSLNPLYRVGEQIVETIRTHLSLSEQAARKRAIDLLAEVGIPAPDKRIDAYPHEFSGGMRQRVMIAMAIANRPALIIADEPTTALDVTIQAQILDVLQTARRATGAAIVLITHDLGVIAGIADRVAVMYAGTIVESGAVDDVFYRARMPYTLGLLGSIPRADVGNREPLTPIEGTPPSLVQLPPGCPFAPRCPMAQDVCATSEPPLRPLAASGTHHLAACHFADDIERDNRTSRDIFPAVASADAGRVTTERRDRPTVLSVAHIRKTYPLMKGAVLRRRVGSVHAVDDISFDIREGETLGLVGESGCGKTTTIMEILNLGRPEHGRIDVLGRDTSTMSGADRLAVRRDLQVVFQDPMASLDPRLPVGDILAEPLRAHGAEPAAVSTRIRELLDLVGLRPEHINRYPQAFSGGQRQRIGIARALALEPRVLVLDEPVSALDVSVRAGVINLLERLRERLGLSYLFVAHDLAVVRYLANRIAVMYLGRIAEIGRVDDVFERPMHPYTQALLSAIPLPDPQKERRRTRIVLQGDLPSPANPPSGCRFRTRCQKFANELNASQQERCVDESPMLTIKNSDADHLAACHWATAATVL